MKILIASSEIAPFAKTGGLAETVGELSKKHAEHGLDVTAIMPFYSAIDTAGFQIKNTYKSINVPISNRLERGEIYQCRISPGVNFFFIRHDKYFNREHIYDTPQGAYVDNAERFIFFSRSILETCKALNLQPDLIHLNDWHTGLVAVYLKTLYRDDQFFHNIATLFTIHNVEHQGIFGHHEMHLTNLSWDLFTPEGIEFYGKINFMKGGIFFSDILNTVSKTYCSEIQTPEYAYSLEGVLRKKREILYGILNGIDYKQWNPESDKNIAKNYSIKNITGKWECKKNLLKRFGLQTKKKIPLIGMVSRLVDQKGFDLLNRIMDILMQMDVQLLILGSGQEKYQKLFTNLTKKYSDKFKIEIGFNETLAHQIEAGADIFLMPSLYEPCGLNQLYSLKYGTVPIVRQTGGLNDTVESVDPSGLKGTGFKFREYSPEALLCCIDKALFFYKNKPLWRGIMKRGMKKDFSWTKPAMQYIDLYEKAITKACK